MRLLDVQYAEILERNIISYGVMEKKGFTIEYRDSRHVKPAMTGGPVVFNVQITNNVLMVRAQGYNSG